MEASCSPAKGFLTRDLRQNEFKVFKQLKHIAKNTEKYIRQVVTATAKMTRLLAIWKSDWNSHHEQQADWLILEGTFCKASFHISIFLQLRWRCGIVFLDGQKSEMCVFVFYRMSFVGVYQNSPITSPIIKTNPKDIIVTLSHSICDSQKKCVDFVKPCVKSVIFDSSKFHSCKSATSIVKVCWHHGSIDVQLLLKKAGTKQKTVGYCWSDIWMCLDGLFILVDWFCFANKEYQSNGQSLGVDFHPPSSSGPCLAACTRSFCNFSM